MHGYTMSRKEFKNWMAETGYSEINDWNMQQIGGFSFYFIKNYKTGLFALIRRDDIQVESGFSRCFYWVLVEDWVDYNGWHDQ